jgi:hypothetical protein
MQDTVSKLTKAKRAGSIAEVVEPLPSKHKALSSTSKGGREGGEREKERGKEGGRKERRHMFFLQNLYCTVFSS